MSGSSPADTPIVSAIIVNYMTSAMARRCIASLAQQEVAHEVIVLDNASPDGDARNLEGMGARLIRNPDNIGYGKACNVGAAAASGRYICILNPDAMLPPGALAAWLAACERELAFGRPVGVLAPRLLNDNGTPQRSTYQFVNAFNYWLYHSAFAGLLKQVRKRVAMDAPQGGALPHAVDWVMGSAMLIPRKAWDATGGFGGNYFLYAEDTDLCWRMREAGFVTLFAPEVSIFHSQGEPSPDRRDVGVIRLFEGIQTFIRQHYSPLRQAGVSLSVIADMLLRLMMFAPLAFLWPRTELHRRRMRGYAVVLAKFLSAR